MANNKIAFGLCEQHNIKLPKDATPKDAWNALKKRGIDISGNKTDGGTYYPTNSLEPYKKSSYKKVSQKKLSPEQYARWSKMLADGLHGDYIFESEGKKYITVDNLIVISSGPFDQAHIDAVYKFTSENEMYEFYNLLRKWRK